MTEKQQNENENENEFEYDVNLQFLSRVREDVFKDPKTQAVVIVKRNDDSSVFTVADEDNLLLSFSS
ncbi:hypothetical protein R84B8_00843 [Treponema sp. R8-4-B8]